MKRVTPRVVKTRGNKRSLPERDKEEKKKKKLELSLYPCLDFLEGPLKRAGIKATCAGTSEADLDYASVYPTECCVAPGDSLLVFKSLWPDDRLKHWLLKI